MLALSVVGERLIGNNGVKLSFALENPPVAGTIEVFQNGTRITEGVEYSIAGQSVVWVVAPLSTDTLAVNYQTPASSTIAYGGLGTTWADIKMMLTYEFGPYVGKGFVNMDSGSPTELAYKVHLAHCRIMAKPHEWEFAKEVGTIVMTGASTYDLRALFPDLISVYQVWGINENQEHPYEANSVINITPADGYSLRGNLLVFSGNAPASGNLSIQYKSSYMVKDSSGVRKKYFTDDTDTSVLDDADIPVLILGAGIYIRRKTDDPIGREKSNRAGAEKDELDQAIYDMMLRPKQSRQLISMM
jgi:hypothetical protein